MPNPSLLAIPFILVAGFEHPPTTSYDFLEGPASFAVDTPRLRVGMPLPNQWTCGVRVTFGADGGSVPIGRLVDHLDIAVEMPGATPIIEIDEVAGTLLVQTDAMAWYDVVTFETLDGSSLADTVHIQLWPYLVEPLTSTVEVLPCETE